MTAPAEKRLAIRQRLGPLVPFGLFIGLGDLLAFGASFEAAGRERLEFALRGQIAALVGSILVLTRSTVVLDPRPGRRPKMAK